MPVVKSLVDVRKGGTPEDRCTNALVWLLQFCSPELACQVLSLAGMAICETLQQVKGSVQEHLAHSRPDAVLEFPGPRYVVIETKIHPGMCSEDQLRNHYRGATRQFGEERTLLLFLSVERTAPTVVRLLSERFPGKVFFLSWQQLLRFLDARRRDSHFKQQFYLEQFFECIRAEKLWRLFSMSTDELELFLAQYPTFFAKLQPAKNSLNDLLTSACTQAVASSGEGAEDWTAKDSRDELPCLYSALKIRGWHTDSSAYVFVNAVLGKIGVILTGYQSDREEKEKFLSRWHESFKSLFAADPGIRIFVWEEEDEVAVEYFKPVEVTAGQAFDPSKIGVFADYFYWGYWHDLEVSDFGKTSKVIAEDFKKLLGTYWTALPAPNKRTSAKPAPQGGTAKTKAASGRK
jgi:hypothetical protein